MVEVSDEELDKLLRVMCLIDYETGSYFAGKLTHVVSPAEFYLIPTSFLSYHRPLLRCTRRLKEQSMVKGAVVIYRSKNPDLHQYYRHNTPHLSTKIRGEIKHIDETTKKCTMLALDHGFLEEKVSYKRMYYPTHMEAITAPPLTFPCTLSKCYPKDGDVFSEEAIQAFKLYTGNRQLRVVIQGKTKYRVEVSACSGFILDIANMLAQLNYTVLVDPKSIGRVRVKFKHKRLCKGDILSVRLQSGTSLDAFYVTEMTDFKEYESKLRAFQDFCGSVIEIGLNDFKPGRAVGARDLFNFSNYERAIITKIVDYGDTAHVKLVDWGMDLVVPKSAVKLIVDQIYVDPPICALYCAAVPGFKPWEDDEYFFHKGHRFDIVIEEVGKGFQEPHIVSCVKNPSYEQLYDFY